MASAERVLYVSKAGIDGHRRFRTLGEAVEATRQGRDAMVSCRIVVENGLHLVEAPVHLDARDNGLIVEGATGENTTLCGGRRIEGWRPHGDHLWAADVPTVTDGTWDFRTLAVNGGWRNRARMPAQGYFHHMDERDHAPAWNRSATGVPNYTDYTTLAYDPDDIGPDLDAANAEVRVYHSWDESLVGVAALDATAHVMTLHPPCVHPPGTFCRHEYVVWNTRQGMTQPGQWYLDRTAGKVVYWPLPGEEPDAIEAIAPVLESIVQIHGAENAPAESIMIRNLTFTAARSCLTNAKLLDMVSPTMTEVGASIGVGGRNSEGAVSMRHAASCVLAGLTLRQIGGQAIKGRNLRDCRIVDCEISDIGGAGIHLDHVDSVDIANNRIHGIGRIFPSANAVLLTHADHAVVLHNEIDDAPYSGISMHTCRNASVCSNRIRRVMQELHDGGGIYIAYGEQAVVRGNFVSDFTASDRAERDLRHAYYCDIGCLDCLIEGNVAARCTAFVHVHMASHVSLRGNMFLSDRSGEISFRRSADCLFERNVVQVEDGLQVHDMEHQIVHRNVLYSRNGRIVARSTHEPGNPECSLLIEPSNVHVDPAIVEERAGRFRVSSQGLSDALDLKPANVTTAGRIEGQRQLFTLTEDVVTSHGGLYHALRQGMMAHRAGKTRL